MTTGYFTVTGDANNLVGWTTETLAEALRIPLGKLGIEVTCIPKQFGGVCYVPIDDETSPSEDYVQYVVERVICLGK
ncbi:MAG: hypothetical protein WC936_03615 [Candidatus Nanoarchaeia archaeon]